MTSSTETYLKPGRLALCDVKYEIERLKFRED